MLEKAQTLDGQRLSTTMIQQSTLGLTRNPPDTPRGRYYAESRMTYTNHKRRSSCLEWGLYNQLKPPVDLREMFEGLVS